MSDFSELLLEAEKLTANIDEVTELPKIDRSIRQVLQDSNELFKRVTTSGSQDVQANLLLGSQGVDLPRIVQKLDHISSKHTLEPFQPTVDTDVPSYLQNETQNIIISVIEESFRKCAEATKSNAWEHEKSEWLQERSQILNAMTAPSHEFSLPGSYASVFTELPAKPSTMLGNQEATYAVKLTEYNKMLRRGNRLVNLVNTFASAAEEFKNMKVNDMWEILKYMTEIPPFPAKEDPVKARHCKPVVTVLVKQAKKYLEDRYKTYMTNVINENLAEARRGGTPGTYSLARSFVGVRLQGEYTGLQGGLVDERPLWPVVYYCLRSGDLTATIHCLKKAAVDVSDLIKLLEIKFKNPDSSEIAKLEAKLQFDYRHVIHNSTDPFQRVVYDVLCCCNMHDEHSEIAKTADDYLWLKLSYLRFNSEKDDSEMYGYLQSIILEEYGEVHYNALNQPHLYFQMLALTGQFEAAFEFLARLEKYQIHSVHMAIALNELHILAVPAYPGAALLSIDNMDPKPSRRLNICRLIMIYVQRFELVAPKEAIQYYYTLRNVLDEDKQNVFVRCVVDLAIEVHDYEMLFGKMRADGTRSTGFLDEFLSDDVKIEEVAQAVGKKLVDKGSLEEAIDLYDIAKNQEEVLSLLRTLLSQVVHLKSTEGSLRERLPPKVAEISKRYSTLGYNCSATSVSSFVILKDLLTFFDQYHSKQFASALKTLEDIEIIPLKPDEIEQRVNSFKRLSIDVNKVIPDVVLATMNILFEQYQKMKSREHIPNRYQLATQDNQLEFIRSQAKGLTNFTGMLPYHMPGDFNSRLAQMEILMH